MRINIEQSFLSRFPLKSKIIIVLAIGFVVAMIGFIFGILAPISAEERIQRTIKALDEEKASILIEASRAELSATSFLKDAETYLKEADRLNSEARKAQSWAQSCRAANQTGTLSLPVDCSTMTVTEDSEQEINVIMEKIMPQAAADIPKADLSNSILFLNPGHGLGEGGSRDWGATIYAEDGKTVLFSERSTVKEIASKLQVKLIGSAFSTVVPVGYAPNTLRSNIEYANKKARELNCTPETCYLLSIHANASDTPTSSGAVVYYNAAMPGARTMAARIARSANQENWRVAEDTANKNKRLGMVRDVEGVNSFLLEVGYMSNQDDLKRMLNADKVATSIAEEFTK
jgi:N-acetylmuramoyl-L-alanine amidase